MNLNWKALIFLVYLPFLVPASNGDARRSGLGGFAYSSGHLALYANPAGLVDSGHSALSIGLAHHYFIRALDLHQLAFSISRKNNAAGLHFSQQGDHRLSENALAFAYSHRISPLFSSGMRMKITHLSFDQFYGRKAFLMVDLGLACQLKEDLILHAYLENAGRQITVREFNERAASSFSIGLMHRYSKQLSLMAEVEKSSGRAMNQKLALEYRASQKFFLQLGYQVLYARLSGGCTAMLAKWSISMASDFTQGVGFSFMLTIRTSLGKD